MSDAPILRLTDLTKSFGGVMAVNEVGFDVHAGSMFGSAWPRCPRAGASSPP